MSKMLTLLETNAALTNAQLAAMLGQEEFQVAAAREAYEKAGVICGYRTVIDWEKTDRTDYVTARIGIKVTPKKGMGYEELAAEICKFEEVESAYLVSGGSNDLELTVSGKSFRDIAMFVAERLAPLESILSTATSFMLRKYKKSGIVVSPLGKKDDREVTSL